MHYALGSAASLVEASALPLGLLKNYALWTGLRVTE